MERDTLSFRQLMALFWVGLLGPAAQLLPGPAGQAGGVGAWGITAAVALTAVGGWAFFRLARGQEGPGQGILTRLGPLWGKIVLIIYIGWGGVLLTARLRAGAQRLVSGGQRDGAAWFFLLVLGLMALWIARGHLGALGRAGEVMFAALLLVGGGVLLLGLFQTRGENLLTRWDWSLHGVLSIVWPGVCVFGYGLFAAFLIQPQEMQGAGGHWMSWLLTGGVVLGVAQTILLGCFGAELSWQLDSPFFQLAKSVGIEGGFQRLESVVAAIWAFSDLILLGTILWGMGSLAQLVIPHLSRHAVVTTAALASMVTAIALFGQHLPLSAVMETWIPVGNVILGVVVPVLLAILPKKAGESGS